MSLISGKYWTGDPKIKPEAWGPAEDVAFAIRANAEIIGIPAPKGAFPIWEGSDIPYDVINAEKGTFYGSTRPTWQRGVNGLELYHSVSNNGFFFFKCIKGMGYGSNEPWSIFAIARPGSLSQLDTVASIGSTSNSYWHGLSCRYQAVDPNSLVMFEVDAYKKVTINTTGKEEKDNLIFAGANYSSSFRKVFVSNKNKISIEEDTGTATNRAIMNRFGLGIYADSSPAGYNPIINLVYFWQDYAITDNCFAVLADNPYVLLQPITRRSYFIPSGEITIKTISDSGFCSDTISGITNQLSVIDIGSGIDGFYGMSAELYVSDAGVSSESVKPIAAISVNDTASAIDAITQILSYCSVVDSGSAADSIANILASVAVTDAGSGFDIINVLKELLKTVTDSCSCVDNVSQISVSSSVSDSASGIDILSQILADISVTDTGSGADFLSLITDILKTISDLGTGIDSISIQPVSVSVQDVGLALDLIGNIAVSLYLTDSATADEIISTIKTKLVAVSDAAIGYDNQSISVSLTVADTITAIDTIKQIINALSISDAGFGIESISKIDLDNTPSGRVRITITMKAPGISITSRTPGIYIVTQ